MITENLLTTHIGAEIEGIDLRSSDLATHADFLIDALARHQVVFFRDQHLNLEQQKSLTRVFGPLSKLSYVEPLDGEPYVIRVLKEADEVGGTFGGDWHTDFSFLPAPPKASCLYGREIPSFGGDTLFASMTKAYENLSPGMQDMLRDMKVVHSGKRSYGTTGTFANKQLDSIAVEATEAGDEEVLHPVVAVIPESGKRSLFVNDIYAIRFENMTEEESAPLLNFLCGQARRPENLCRLDWQQGSLAIWDNRTTMHYAVNDYDGQRREMHRVTISGEPLEGIQP